MGLSSDLISQFVKVTRDDKKTDSETTVYGTIEVVNDSTYIVLDGDNEKQNPIPLSNNQLAVTVVNGDRVRATIKNHNLVVTGNIKNPSATTEDVRNTIDAFETIVASKASVDELYAERARIDVLVTEDVTIKERLSANEADIIRIDADNVTINEKLTANSADISKLKTDKLDANTANITYATISELDAAEADIYDLEVAHGNFVNATADNFEAVNADISDLKADKLDVEIAEATYATIGELNAANASIDNLEGTYGDFQVLVTNKFEAFGAEIDTLQATKLSATDADLKYANIDFSNIGKAAIEHFYATSGLIEDVVVGDGTITGRLVGVTISGDLIEGNTVKAEKLVIKGSDGLYYKLNTDGMKTEAQQTDENSINGSVIKAKSITATKISVSDLVAFGATIGGINIASGALYSGAKASVDNTAIGVYLDKHGQLAVGDASKYLKYYTDANGNRRLEISADSLIFGSSKKNVETAFTDINTKANTIDSKIGEGGNLFLNGTPSSSSNWGLNHGVTYVNGYFSVPAYVPSTEGSHGDTISQGFADRIPFASYERKFKIAFDARDTSNGNQTGHIALWLRWKKEDGSQNWPAFDLQLSDLTSEWASYSGFITIPAECKVDAFGIGLYTTSAFDIRSLFLEEATDLFNTQKDITNVQTMAAEAQERVSEAESIIQQLSDNISMLVTDGNGTSLMTQTEDGWTFSTADMQALVDKASEDLNDLTNEVGDVNNTVDILRQAVSDLGVIAEYVKIGTYEDEPCIELGEGDSEFKLRITNTRMMFVEGSNVLAYFNNQSLHIKKAVVEEELQQGGFVWKARSNGNLGLVWKGGTS